MIAPCLAVAIALDDPKARGIVLMNGRVAPSVGRSVTEQRFITVGRTEQGRPLFVAFVIREVAGRVLMRPVSARYMHEKEAKRYEA